MEDKPYPVPLSMTTAGREVGSIGKKNKGEGVVLVVVMVAVGVDLRARSKRDLWGRDHGHEARLKKRK